MKVLVYSAKAFEIPFLNKHNNGKHQLTFVTKHLQTKNASLAEGHKAISIFSADRCDASVLTLLFRIGIKYITLRSTGYDNVDLKTATRLGMKVARVPEYSPHAIAEHAVGLLLSAVRKIPIARNQVKALNFTLDNLVGFDLHGKTAGIVGTGRIGKVIAQIMKGFGCKLLGTDIYPDEEFARKNNLQYLPLNSLLEQSDIVFLAVPLNSDTERMIDAAALSHVKKHCYLVNVARGGVVATLDVIEALEQDRLGFYATDVYEKESGIFFRDRSKKGVTDPILLELIGHPRVLLTPHQAFTTHEAVSQIAETTIYSLDCWDVGRSSEFELGG